MSALLLGLLSCGSPTAKKTATHTEQAVNTNQAAQAKPLQILYFHGKQRCITCNAIERLTREVVDSIGSDKIAMRILDISKAQNQPLAQKYEVTWSSLILEHNGKAENLTKMGFSYAKNQPAVFKQKLNESITKIVEDL